MVFFLAEKCHRWKWAALSPPAKYTGWERIALAHLSLKSQGTPPPPKQAPGQLHDIQLEKGNRFVTSLLNGVISSQSWGVPIGTGDKITLLALYSCSEDTLVSNLRMGYIKNVVGVSVTRVLIYRFFYQRKQNISLLILLMSVRRNNSSKVDESWCNPWPLGLRTVYTCRKSVLTQNNISSRWNRCEYFNVTWLFVYTLQNVF